MAEWTLLPGAKIRRTDLHDQFGGGGRPTGISPSAQTPSVFIFSDSETGDRHGYIDSWKSEGCFHYTGEGQRGDQRMVGGNRAILTASKTATKQGSSRSGDGFFAISPRYSIIRRDWQSGEYARTRAFGDVPVRGGPRRQRWRRASRCSPAIALIELRA
jgi:hypothetical protein